MLAMVEEIGWAEAGALVRRYDTEDPDFFLAWKERRDPEVEAS